MIFRLLESVSDGYIETDIIGTLFKTAPVVQDTVGLVVAVDKKGNRTAVEKPTAAEVKSGYVFHWTEAERVADARDVEKLIFAYTSTYAVDSKLDNNVVNTLRSLDIWIHIVSELGFRNQANPFITYVLKYKNFNTNLMRSQLIVLNNLFSNKTINNKDLEDVNSILYNPAIWSLSMENASKLLENYFYVKKHHKSYDTNITPNNNTERAIKTRMDAHLDKMENYMVFKTGGDAASKGTDLESAYIIEEFVNKFFNRTTKRDDKSTVDDDDNKSTARLDPQKKTAIDKAIQDGFIKYSDLDGIVSYIKDLHDSGRLR